MKKFFFGLFCFITSTFVFAAGEATAKGESRAALVIVVLLFIVLFAWPPIFKKITDKYDNKNSAASDK